MVSLSTCWWIGFNCTTVPPSLCLNFSRLLLILTNLSHFLRISDAHRLMRWHKTTTTASCPQPNPSWWVTHRRVAAAAGGPAAINCNSDGHEQHQQMEEEQDPWRSLNQALRNRHRTSLFEGSNHFIQEAKLSVWHLELNVTMYLKLFLENNVVGSSFSQGKICGAAYPR